MGLRQRLSKPQYSVKYGFEAHDSGEKRGSRKIIKNMGLRQREAAKLLKVWVCCKILHKSTSLGQLFNKRRNIIRKNAGFRLTLYH